MTVARNMSLPDRRPLRQRGLIDEDAERRAVLEMATSRSSTPQGMARPVGALSGGNQQKVLLGKWLLTDAEVVLLDDPTQGVDVGTKHEIGVQIHRIADEGTGVILFSTDVDELVSIWPTGSSSSTGDVWSPSSCSPTSMRRRSLLR